MKMANTSEAAYRLQLRLVPGAIAIKLFLHVAGM